MDLIVGLLAHGGKPMAHQPMIQPKHTFGIERCTFLQKPVCLLSVAKNTAPVVLDVCGQQYGLPIFVGIHMGPPLYCVGKSAFPMVRVYTEYHVKGC